MRPPILVVDDNKDAGDMMVLVLNALGYAADAAVSGADALCLIEKKHYGLAILDYKMPHMNGVDLLQRMHAIHPELDAIFLTGHPDINVVYPAMQAGASRVLAKPVEWADLRPILEHFAPTMQPC